MCMVVVAGLSRPPNRSLASDSCGSAGYYHHAAHDLRRGPLRREPLLRERGSPPRLRAGPRRARAANSLWNAAAGWRGSVMPDAIGTSSPGRRRLGAGGRRGSLGDGGREDESKKK